LCCPPLQQRTHAQVLISFNNKEALSCRYSDLYGSQLLGNIGSILLLQPVEGAVPVVPVHNYEVAVLKNPTRFLAIMCCNTNIWGSIEGLQTVLFQEKQMHMFTSHTFSLHPALQMWQTVLKLGEVCSCRKHGEVTSFTSPPLRLQHPCNPTNTTLSETKEHMRSSEIRQSILCDVFFPKHFELTATALNCCLDASLQLQPAPSQSQFLNCATQRSFQTRSKDPEELPLQQPSSVPWSFAL
jgi:hypothetical protein